MVQVKVKEGILEGETVSNVFGGTFHSFKGVPYAAPPIGDLRFKAPQPPKSWEGVRSAKQCGKQCYQFNFITRRRESGSEDCLFLNIYTLDLNPEKAFPVMIWIHGGAFCCGNGNDETYGPEFLIRHGVILVTINYRLEILGFLCLDTKEVPGNAGIKDQVAAMRWVKSNISNFGGDPDNITIFGQSSGAACVTYHCLSPMTKGLFKRAIAQSGVMTNWYAQSYRPRERAVALAKSLGCTSEDDIKLYEFFKKQPLEALAEIQVPLTFAEKVKDKYETQFSVVSEKYFPDNEPFFTGDFIKALKNDIHKDIELIIGYNENEGVLTCAVSFDIKNTIYQANNFKEYMVPKSISLYCSIDNQLHIGSMFKKYYTQNKTITINNMDELERYYGMECFKFDVLQVAKTISIKNKVYFYKFTCKSERNFTAMIFGVSNYFKGKILTSHMDEIAYLFPVKSVSQKIGPSSQTFKAINTVTKLWTNFAKTGKPTPDISLGVNWREFNPKSQPFLEIGNKLVNATKPDEEEFTFWENIFKTYLPSRIYQDS
ncbi:hypothetical protein ACJJTC_007355 [Scirpophaga incertulas]